MAAATVSDSATEHLILARISIDAAIQLRLDARYEECDAEIKNAQNALSIARDRVDQLVK